MAMGAMIGLGKGAASHIPSLDKLKKTQHASIRNKKQLGQLGYERVWGPNDKGPLGNPNDVNSPAATFRGGSYTEKILDKDLILHRTYGDKAGPIGQYWSSTPQHGGLQSQLDAALNPSWGNNASKIHTITIPKGTTVYMGSAAPQTINAGTGVLYGGAQQTFVPWATLNNLGFK
jgi:filamentous hemagglutinin